MVREIPLTRGLVALVDDDDFNIVDQYKWYAAAREHNVYAVRSSVRSDEVRGNIFLHRVIIGAPVDLIVDHIDGDGLNCQRSNLRLANDTTNNMNKKKSRSQRAGSQYKGVHWHKGRWAARIQVNRDARWLGRFESEIDAAFAYDTAARQLFGEYARLNFPLDGEQAA